MSFTDFLEDQLLDHLLGAGTRDYPSPTALHEALSTVIPGDDGTPFTEPVGNGYARVPVGVTFWPVSAGGSVANILAIAFPQASGGNWGNIVYGGKFDALTVGQILTIMDVPDVLVNDGDDSQYAIGNNTTTLN